MGVIIPILSDTSNVERDIVCHTLPLADIGRCFCAVRNIYLYHLLIFTLCAISRMYLSYGLAHIFETAFKASIMIHLNMKIVFIFFGFVISQLM